MSKSYLNLSEVSNHEDKIYVGTMEEILRRAGEFLKVDDGRGFAGNLTRAMQENFLDFKDTDYLRGIAKKMRDAKVQIKDPYVITIRNQILYTLQRAANFSKWEIKNFKDFDAKFNPIIIPCVYTSSGYSGFQLFRTYKTGRISGSLKGWLFESDEFLLENQDLLSIKPYKMNGEEKCQWVRICYRENGKTLKAFFGQIENNILQIQTKDTLLYKFLINFRSKQTEEEKDSASI